MGGRAVICLLSWHPPVEMRLFHQPWGAVPRESDPGTERLSWEAGETGGPLKVLASSFLTLLPKNIGSGIFLTSAASRFSHRITSAALGHSLEPRAPVQVSLTQRAGSVCAVSPESRVHTRTHSTKETDDTANAWEACAQHRSPTFIWFSGTTCWAMEVTEENTSPHMKRILNLLLE